MKGRFHSVTTKMVALVGVSSAFTAVVVWAGTRQGVHPLYTLPFAILAAILIAVLVSSTIVDPLKQATRAAKSMARGDYSMRVTAVTSDEVGQLAEAFNSMATDLAEVDRLHRDIVANVSHELRTPVAALRSRLENMADGVEAPTQENLEAAVHQVERLTELLQYLLDLSRIDAGVVGLDLRTIGVADLIGDAIEVTRLASTSRGRTVHFTSRVEPADLTLRGDRGRLAQVLVNVLDNAVRHAPDGTTVRVEAMRTRLHVRIEVADDGPGIEPKDRERIFGRFQRGTPAGSPATGGTGIGLAIARWAVSIHGGTIDVVDSDAGATFRILLPVAGPGVPAPRFRRAEAGTHEG